MKRANKESGSYFNGVLIGCGVVAIGSLAYYLARRGKGKGMKTLKDNLFLKNLQNKYENCVSEGLVTPLSTEANLHKDNNGIQVKKKKKKIITQKKKI